MAQFDVFRNPRPGDYPLLLDVQADVLAGLASRVVVPMTPRKGYSARPITRLNPVVTIGRTDHVLVFQELAAVPTSALGEVVESLARHRTELVAAIDLLFTGL
jgi:toxin CcdB